MDSGTVRCAGIHRRLDLYGMNSRNEKLPDFGFGVCFSGHRPEKLPEGEGREILKSMLHLETENAIKDGARVFYTGMARGVDLYAAEMILDYRHRFPDIRLICACHDWPQSQVRYLPQRYDGIAPACSNRSGRIWFQHQGSQFVQWRMGQ